MNKQRLMDLELKVDTLIEEDGKWNEYKINELFPPADVKRIKDLPTGSVNDRLIWAYTQHGAYTVKSGPISPKIRMFFWRAISGALAVSDRLRTRGINIDTTCHLCQQGTESICHVLFNCPTALHLLSEVDFKLPTNGFSMSLEENMSYVLDLMEDHSIPLTTRRAIPWFFWNIWKKRNAILYSGTQEPSSIIMNRAVEEAEIWAEVNKSEPQQPIVRTAGICLDKRWHPPNHEMLKCNLHANWRNSELHSVGAWIARDHRGNVRFHAREAFTNSPNRMIAELRCIMWAMQSLADLRIKEVVIASDHPAVIEAILKPTLWPRLRSFTGYINRLRGTFNICDMELEHPKGNSIARDISKSVTREG
ncbi:unnamed protein product [Thlaspi arvense]|uniref:Reverse transcriptase zinc-binding domain-containing protein n=1 Tax=Thlaspi arvense TaxID=13288 RepID=A0AAU9T6N0_THLAR|nr:unnamed protein product [Thlaspi arvense]